MRNRWLSGAMSYVRPGMPSGAVKYPSLTSIVEPVSVAREPSLQRAASPGAHSDNRSNNNASFGVPPGAGQKVTR